MTIDTVGNSAALIVHHSPENYGNHLVNFAAKRMLEMCGLKTQLITFRDSTSASRRAMMRRFPKKTIRLITTGQIVDRVRSRFQPSAERERLSFSGDYDDSRRAAFQDFDEEYLGTRLVPTEDRHALAESFDIFAIGSDQIWNYDYAPGPWHFADFVETGRKITLSPSIGHESIPFEWRSFYRCHLSRFREVATREIEWAASLGQFENVSFFHSLDPTLMIEKKVWESVRSRYQVSDTPYLLLYELGGISSRDLSKVHSIAERVGLRVVTLSKQDDSGAWATNAADFLSMIAGASLVATDSYHGAIFSLIFDRPLAIIERDGFAGEMNTRIRSLCQLLPIENRMLRLLDVSNATQHSYADAYEALALHQRDYWDYLARQGIARREDSK